MPTTVSSMPYEVLHTILNNIDSKVELGECRMVCKRWDPVAEAIMFSKEIYLAGDDSFVKLHDRLVEKPHLARHIKQIQGRSLGVKIEPIVNLVKLSFTPNMEILAIEAMPHIVEKINDHLLNVVRKAPNADYKLKRLPQVRIMFCEPEYGDTVLAFKNSLQHMQASYLSPALFDEFGRLLAFKHVETLELYIQDPSDIIKLETMLKNYGSLKRLGLEWDPYDEHTLENMADIMPNWSRDNVQQDLGLTEIGLTNVAPLLIPYLLYKYPNIKSWYTTEGWFYDDTLFSAILEALPMPPFSLETMIEFHEHSSVFSAITQIDLKFDYERADTTVILGFEQPEYVEADMIVSVINDPHPRITYQINTANDISYADQKWLFDHLVEATEKHPFGTLQANMLYGRQRQASTKELSFYDFLLASPPDLQSLKLSTDRIEYEQQEIYNIYGELLEMKQLSISNAVIDAQVLPQISDFFPNLHMLTLASCTTVNDKRQEHHQGKLYSIHLPKSKLSLLVLAQADLRANDPGDFVAHCEKMKSESSIQGDCYMEVSVLCFDIVFYCKLNGSSAPVQMTAQEFESRQNKNTAASISITCDRFLCIAIRLGDLNVDLNLATLWEKCTADRNEMALTDGRKFFLEAAPYCQSLYQPFGHRLASIM